MKKILKVLFLIMVVVLLAGCTPHNKKEVKKYVSELLNHNSFRLTGSKKSRKWTVKDKKTGHTFNVIDFWYYSSESGHYILVNDINDTLLRGLHNIINDSNIKLIIDDDPMYFDYTTVNFECEFNNLEELKECATSFEAYDKAIEHHNNNSEKPYVITNFKKIYTYETGNQKYYSEYKPYGQDDYEYVKEKYFNYGVRNRIDSIIEEAKQED